MTTSKLVVDFAGRGYKESVLKKGDSFSITHCDGYVANEVISNISFLGGKFYYTCESCSTYSEDDLKTI